MKEILQMVTADCNGVDILCYVPAFCMMSNFLEKQYILVRASRKVEFAWLDFTLN
jgi:hypothetical protein